MSDHREAAQTAMNQRDFAAANVHALLYLADEQRMANMIAAIDVGLAFTSDQQLAVETYVYAVLAEGAS
ncbi:hypothetical protein [Nocardia vulneris]|uniref:hypothetical protein n=1 Tax=Nocardia vulneris TaxID=1141657 RepID=UPI000ACFB825|nr:hypothetical protein [Nocardia vulneris]